MVGRRISDGDKVTIKKQIVQLLGSGCYIETACEAVGISTDTFNRWEKADAAFAAQSSRAKPMSWIADLASMRSAAISGDWRAAEAHLDRTGSPYRKSVDINLNIRARAERIAADLGLSVDEVLAEAESIVAVLPR